MKIFWKIYEDLRTPQGFQGHVFSHRCGRAAPGAPWPGLSTTGGLPAPRWHELRPGRDPVFERLGASNHRGGFSMVKPPWWNHLAQTTDSTGFCWRMFSLCYFPYSSPLIIRLKILRAAGSVAGFSRKTQVTWRSEAAEAIFGGFHSNGGTPKWMVHNGKSH